MPAHTHPALSSVAWKDLLHLRRRDVVLELLISLPWLVASCAAASRGWHLLALAGSFMFFLTGLRQVHNAYHQALGLSRRATEWVMFALSILMLGSMHAVQINHLRHHRFCLQAEDVEAMSARLPAWQALLIGPFFPFRLHHKALQVATRRQRGWIVAELAGNATWVALVFGVLDWPWLQYHVLAMLAGQCLTAFFAVWTVHHGCETAPAPFARTIRGRIRSALTYNMFYHVEHHLFPAVPTCRLQVLSARLDAAAPLFAEKKVF
jgi:fatty acid desaturase